MTFREVLIKQAALAKQREGIKEAAIPPLLTMFRRLDSQRLLKALGGDTLVNRLLGGANVEDLNRIINHTIRQYGPRSGSMWQKINPFRMDQVRAARELSKIKSKYGPEGVLQYVRGSLAQEMPNKVQDLTSILGGNMNMDRLMRNAQMLTGGAGNLGNTLPSAERLVRNALSGVNIRPAMGMWGIRNQRDLVNQLVHAIESGAPANAGLMQYLSRNFGNQYNALLGLGL